MRDPALRRHNDAMRCRLCAQTMGYVHGHAACLRSGCPMFGVNQAECCDGETIANCPLTTADIARVVAAPSSERK